jgi:xanthine dehydrogenase YagS FAD-binding subunit
MEPFTYHRPSSWGEVARALQQESSRLMGGGTDLVPLMRERVTTPQHVVDVRGVPEAADVTWLPDGGVSIGAGTTLRTIADDPDMRRRYPAVALACASAGSFQLRQMGTLGGNLCQRVRCWYFRNDHSCLRRGDAICSAEIGENQYHAIFRQGPCVAVHPSDPAVALVACAASVSIAGPQGERQLAVSELLITSRQRLDAEVALGADEVITAIHLPGSTSGGRQYFEKLTQRATWDFALASIAAVRRTNGDVRIVLGGVANVPWRVPSSIEEDVASGGLSNDDVETLAQRALYDAQPLELNAYKVDLAAALLRRAITAISD